MVNVLGVQQILRILTKEVELQTLVSCIEFLSAAEYTAKYFCLKLIFSILENLQLLSSCAILYVTLSLRCFSSFWGRRDQLLIYGIVRQTLVMFNLLKLSKFQII